ncbi:prokineticin receptor 2-like [Anneissia japonica]|uniref:prokineticin receptor 2-like n=1 Tax=Anneissia japonica TaxID=1529436 RepID=UPI00142582DD|nr:prokineticin receptor 2-like [Anneissia japonica]
MEPFYNYIDYSYDNEYNSNSTINYEKKHLIEVPLTIKVTLAIVYICMMLICGIGNLLLCCVIIRYRRMRTTTNILIGNLAWSDFLIAVICIPFNFHHYTTLSWPYGEAVCMMVNYVKNASLYVSTNSLLVMALDRYVIIMNPLRPRMTRLSTIIIIALVWVFSFCLAIPTGIHTNVTAYETEDKLVTLCVVHWTKGHQVRNYTLFIIIIAFIIPLFAMIILYSRIAVKLWFRKIPGNQCTAKQAAASNQSKKRSVRMLIILVLAFAVCLTPYYCFIFARDVMMSLNYGETSVWYFFYIVECLAMSNSIVDTVTYVILNPNCRKHGRMLLADTFPKCFEKPSISSVQGMQLTRRATTSSVGRMASTGNSFRTSRSTISYQSVPKGERSSTVSIVKEDTDST